MDQIYKYFRWLSMDIVLGAIFFLAYLEDYYHIYLSVHVYFALGSAIWLIYTADHLIDSRASDVKSQDRHGFHKRNFVHVVFSGGLVLSLALANLYFLESEILKVGALLASGCVLYLLLVYHFQKLWVKELLVAIVYAIGIFLGPFVLVKFYIYDWLLVFQLALVALANLLIFSKFDLGKDESEGFGSLVLRMGESRSNLLITALLWGIIILSFSLFTHGGDEIQLLYLTMTALLSFVYIWPGYFRKSERFRTLGDGIFFLALIFLLF